MKYLLKLQSINYERAMKKCNLMNEIFIEIAQG